LSHTSGKRIQNQDLAYLIYFYPKEINQGGNVRFEVEPYEIKTNPDNAKTILSKQYNFKRSSARKRQGLRVCTWLQLSQKI